MSKRPIVEDARAVREHATASASSIVARGICSWKNRNNQRKQAELAGTIGVCFDVFHTEFFDLRTTHCTIKNLHSACY